MENNALASALVAFQGELEAVEKTAENPFFKSKYADLATVKAAVQPLMKKHSLAVTQYPTHFEGQPALRTRLMHSSGQYDEDTMLLVMAKQDPQGQGSALTYAKRYAFMAVLGIVADDDDDGNRASAKSPQYKTSADKAKMVMGGEEIVTDPDNPPTEPQLNRIRELRKALGYNEATTEAKIKLLKTKGQAGASVAKLKEDFARQQAAEAN